MVSPRERLGGVANRKAPLWSSTAARVDTNLQWRFQHPSAWLSRQGYTNTLLGKQSFQISFGKIAKQGELQKHRNMLAVSYTTEATPEHRVSLNAEKASAKTGGIL
jgi:hypothetical protein